jgi:hypothetical protein
MPPGACAPSSCEQLPALLTYPLGGVHLAFGVAVARWALPSCPRVVPARYASALRQGVVFGSVIPVRACLRVCGWAAAALKRGGVRIACEGICAHAENLLQM